jgi:hypothetical protein
MERNLAEIRFFLWVIDCSFIQLSRNCQLPSFIGFHAGIETPLRTPDRNWPDFLMSVAVGRFDKPLTWNDLATQFGVTVTDDIQVAQIFFCPGVGPN